MGLIHKVTRGITSRQYWFGKWNNFNLLFLSILILANGLMFTQEGGLLRTVGTLIVLLLPGVVYSLNQLPCDYFLRVVMGFGLSYALVIILGLILHYIGPVSVWWVLLIFDILVLATIVQGITTIKVNKDFSIQRQWSFWILFIILLGAAFFFLTNLGYSEFDGDEVKALIPAAESIEGRYDALFYLRKKGPGEILLPAMVWRLTGLINEFNARLPFALVGLLTILTTYLLGYNLFGDRVGLLAAGFVALNGLLVAFARIVQYQQLVVWLSLLSFLCIWQWRKDNRAVWWILAGVFLGVGLLCHYDTVLVVPALVYVFFSTGRFTRVSVITLAISGIILTLIVSLFLVPYFLNPQVLDTTDYLGQRVGGGSVLKNNLYDFFHINIFYSSFYYVVTIGILALGFLLWTLSRLTWIRRLPARNYFIPAIIGAGIILVSLYPDTLHNFSINWAFVVFALIFLGAFLSPVSGIEGRAIIIWLATTFLGYNFWVASPRTHFYTILLPVIFLASLSAGWLWEKLKFRSNHVYLPVTVCMVAILLFGGYLYHVFLRPEIEFETDWPDSQPALYWFPYDEIPTFDAYGFIHRHGWKTIGGLYATGQLKGEYKTNARYSISSWYTRNALGENEGCYAQTKYFFGLKHLTIDPNVFTQYDEVGEISWHNNGIRIYQKQPNSGTLNPIKVGYLNRLFDSTAKPARFVRPVAIHYSADVTLVNVIQLTDYNIIIPHAKAGERIGVSLYWKSLQPTPLNADVFVHLEDERNTGVIWGQSNGSPGCGKHPTSTWQTNQIIKDRHVVVIDPDIPPGNYVLTAGMYLPETNQRAPILDETDRSVSTAIRLLNVTIE